MNSRTATVEVLTAEVRVIMVGSRQVTMSVFNQLDKVPAKDIKPFGRVRPRDKGDYVHVVGSDDGGNLVRSSLWLSDRVMPGEIFRTLHTGESYAAYLADRQWTMHTKNEWLELPLIVLAGLR